MREVPELKQSDRSQVCCSSNPLSLKRLQLEEDHMPFYFSPCEEGNQILPNAKRGWFEL